MSKRNQQNSRRQKPTARTFKKRTKSNRGGASINVVDGVRSEPNALLKVPRSVGLIMPDRYYCALRYWQSGTTNLSVSNYGSFRFRPSAAYDVDPTAGSTSMAGFSELAALYGSYRVTSSKCVFEVVNPNTSPILAMLVPLNVDPGTSPSVGIVNSYKEQPYSRSRLVPCTGVEPITLRCDISTEKIYGSKMVYMDDNFSSPVGGIPANNWYWAVGLTSPGVITNPISWIITIDVGVEFYSRTRLTA